MLASPPHEVYERLTFFLSNVSIGSGLVLSAIASTALSPLRLEDFPADRRLTAEVYNVVAAIAVAVQLCVVLYSAFTMYILSASVHNPKSVYKALAHMTSQLELVTKTVAARRESSDAEGVHRVFRGLWMVF